MDVLRKIITKDLPYAIMVGDDKMLGFKFHIIIVLAKNKDKYGIEELSEFEDMKWICEQDLSLKDIDVFHKLKKKNYFDRKLIPFGKDDSISVYEPKKREEDFKLWSDTEKALMEIRD